MAVRWTLKTPAEYAYSGKKLKLWDGAPRLALPPCATYSMLSVWSSTRVFVACCSSDRGRPRTRSCFCHPVPLFVNRDTTPEFVSKFVAVPFTPPPTRGSLDET